MKNFGKLALSTVAVLALAAGIQPAQAACGGSPAFTTYSLTTGDLSMIFSSNSGWENFPGAGSCAAFGCYVPPFHGDDVDGYFWSLGTGNPTVGPGDDNGAFDVSQWVTSDTFGGAGTYWYPAFIQSSWNQAGDGCVFNAGATTSIDATECSCVLLTDSDAAGNSYFALFSDVVDGIGNNSFYQAGGAPIVLVPMPKVDITGSVRQPNFDVALDVVVAAPTAGVYQSEEGGCDCGPVTYRVYEQILPRTDPAPVSRDLAGWTQVAGDTAVGTETSYTSACGGADTNVWLTAVLTFDQGFETQIVTGNSTRVECGANLATPEENQKRPVQLPSRDVRKGGSRGR